MAKRLAVFLWLAAQAVPAQTVQPISKSMVECHVISTMMLDTRRAQSSPVMQVKLQQMADAFIKASVVEARAEGRTSETYVADTILEVTPRWQAQFGSLLKLPDTLDWVDYCRALGLDRGIIE